jgi:hypothetical protein
LIEACRQTLASKLSSFSDAFRDIRYTLSEVVDASAKECERLYGPTFRVCALLGEERSDWIGRGIAVVVQQCLEIMFERPTKIVAGLEIGAW